MVFSISKHPYVSLNDIFHDFRYPNGFHEQRADASSHMMDVQTMPLAVLHICVSSQSPFEKAPSLWVMNQRKCICRSILKLGVS